MSSMPGTSEVRITVASSFNGFADSAIFAVGANCCASAVLMKVRETASSYPRASSVERNLVSAAASGNSTTLPTNVGRLSRKLL